MIHLLLICRIIQTRLCESGFGFSGAERTLALTCYFCWCVAQLCEWGGTDDVEVMDLFMLGVPSMAERCEGQSYGCLCITLWDPWRLRQL